MGKLLFIQYRRSSIVMNGGDLCTKRNYDMLCQVLGKENVDIYLIHDEEDHSSLFAYFKGALYMPFGYFFGLTPKRVAEITQIAQAYKYVFIDRSVFGILARHLKQNNYQGQIITHFHNVETQYFNDKLPIHLPFRSIIINCADQNDADACRYSDEVVTLNKRDADSLKSLYNKEVKNIIPIALEDKYIDLNTDTHQTTSGKLRCLFLGSYFAPNTEGIIWFMNHVAPAVNIDIKIVGKGMSKLKNDHPELLQDIEVISDAKDLTPYLNWADVMILPIFTGSGMKVKTCESLMYGKNIIGTDETFEGYEIQEGISGWRCNTAEEFIACIHDFTQHPRPRLNQAARQLYCKQYSTSAVLDRFRQLCI